MIEHSNDLAKRITEMESQVEDLQLEVMAQARLNGMGAEREALLMGQLAMMTRERNALREALVSYCEAFAMSTIGDYAEIPWTNTSDPAYDGGICSKHGRWYGRCYCCESEFKKLQYRADQIAEDARNNALRTANELARAALSIRKDSV